MNKQQRKTIVSLANDIQKAVEDGMPLPELKIVVKSVVSQLESIRDEEQEKFDNMPEGLQGSSKGEAIQEAIDTLDSAIQDLESVDMSEEGEEEEVGNVLSDAISVLEAV